MSSDVCFTVVCGDRVAPNIRRFSLLRPLRPSARIFAFQDVRRRVCRTARDSSNSNGRTTTVTAAPGLRPVPAY